MFENRCEKRYFNKCELFLNKMIDRIYNITFSFGILLEIAVKVQYI